MSKPPVLYRTTSPAPATIDGNVTLYKHTWENHIQPQHPEVDFFSVKNAMDDPCYIVESATVPGTFVLVNERNPNEWGDALRVPVKPAEGHNIVTTAYYSNAKSHGAIVWIRGKA